MLNSARQVSLCPVVIISFITVAFFCTGLVRVEFKFQEQNKRIEALEAILISKGYSKQALSLQEVEGKFWTDFFIKSF